MPAQMERTRSQEAPTGSPAPPSSRRLYIFECGSIKGSDPALFKFKKEELAEVDFTVTASSSRILRGC